MKLSELSKQITAIIALIILAFSGFFFLDNRYVDKPQFEVLENRVSLNELRRQLRLAEDEAAYYRQLSRKYPDDESIKEKLRQAEERVKELREEIKKREQKI